MTFKYIITKYGAILFGEATTHSDVAEGFGKPLSAGFAEIEFSGGVAMVKCYGASESLGIDSIPEKDEFIIYDLFATVSQIKYMAFDVKGFYAIADKKK